MNTSKNTKQSSKSSVATEPTKATTTDPVADLQAADRQTRSDTPLGATARKERRSVARRSSVAQINLVLSLAEQSGGIVGGIAIDATAMRAQQAQSARNRVGAALARRVAQRLNDRAIASDATIAQRVLAAVAGLEAQSMTAEGSALAPTVAELRGAARRRKSTPRPPVATPVTPPVTPPVTGGAATVHA
jgi:hypothetical protein